MQSPPKCHNRNFCIFKAIQLNNIVLHLCDLQLWNSKKLKNIYYWKINLLLDCFIIGRYFYRSHGQLLVCTIAHQVPPSMGFSRQKHWSGLPRPSPAHLPNPGTESMSLTSPALAGVIMTTSAAWESPWQMYFAYFL